MKEESKDKKVPSESKALAEDIRERMRRGEKEGVTFDSTRSEE